jgi:hypothetical protein
MIQGKQQGQQGAIPTSPTELLVYDTFIKEEGVTCYICANDWDNSSSENRDFTVLLHRFTNYN